MSGPNPIETKHSMYKYKIKKYSLSKTNSIVKWYREKTLNARVCSKINQNRCNNKTRVCRIEGNSQNHLFS